MPPLVGLRSECSLYSYSGILHQPGGQVITVKMASLEVASACVDENETDRPSWGPAEEEEVLPPNSLTPPPIPHPRGLSPEATDAGVASLLKIFPQLSEGCLKRFLFARKGDVDKSADMVRKHLEWREKNLPVPRESCLVELEKRKLYFSGVDRWGHPVLYFRSSRQDPETRDINETVRMSVYTLENMLQHLPDDGQITLFIDRTGATRKNFDSGLLREIASTLGNNYPERLHRAVVYPSGWVFRGIWTIARPFLDPVTASKVSMVGSEADLHQVIHPSNLPERFGGTLPDE